MATRTPLVWMLFTLGLAGCPMTAGDGDGGDAPADAGGGDPAYDVDVEPMCTEGARFEAGTAAFVEATEAWGLAALGVQGTRLSVADIDGDGWADLFVRRGGSRSNDFSGAGARHSWLLRNDGSGFVDVTEPSGIGTPRGALDRDARPYEVAAFADVDNDGDQDVYTGLATADDAVAQGETSEILLNDGTGTFTLGPADNAARRAGAVDAVAGASFVDVDLDGLLDLWTPQHNYTAPGGGLVFAQDRAYRGVGTGAFEDVTTAWGLATRDWAFIADLNAGQAHSRAWGANACDLNGDGVTELLSPSYGRSPNHLWQGGFDLGQVRFTNRSLSSGYAFDENFAWSDNQFARCFCQSNPNAEGCADVGAPVVQCADNWNHSNDRERFRLGGNSGASVCADVDNDGDIDVLTTEIKHWWAGEGSDGSELLLNNGDVDVTFDRPGDAALGLAIEHTSTSWDEGHMTAAVFDFDNDGWPDIYIGGSDYAGNRGLLYHQASPLAFEEVAPVDGIDHNRSHGVAVADFDRDGDLDVIVGHSRSRCDASAPNNCYETAQVRAFENVVGDNGNYLQLKLVGTGESNRDAVGARVTVTAGDVTQTQEVSAGHGHYGAQKDMVLHFGLGPACDATVTVRWPTLDGDEETFLLAGGHRYTVTRGEGVALAAD